MVWNSGVRVRSRSTLSAVTSCSNGTSWWENASRTRRPGLARAVGEGRVGRQVAAQDQGVGEVADDRFELDPVPARDGRADQDVALAGVPGQQRPGRRRAAP